MLILQWRGQLSLHAERSELSLGKILFQRPHQIFQTICTVSTLMFYLTHFLRQPNLTGGRRLEKMISARWLHKVPEVCQKPDLTCTLACFEPNMRTYLHLRPVNNAQIWFRKNNTPTINIWTSLSKHCGCALCRNTFNSIYYLKVLTFSTCPRRISEPIAIFDV